MTLNIIPPTYRAYVYNTQCQHAAQCFYELMLQHVSASVLGHLQGARNFVQLLCQDGIKYYIYITVVRGMYNIK